jgi:hypothetical protein
MLVTLDSANVAAEFMAIVPVVADDVDIVIAVALETPIVVVEDKDIAVVLDNAKVAADVIAIVPVVAVVVDIVIAVPLDKLMVVVADIDVAPVFKICGYFKSPKSFNKLEPEVAGDNQTPAAVVLSVKINIAVEPGTVDVMPTLVPS